MPPIYLFADTNLLLHYQPLHQIDWSKLGDFDQIEVIVCRTVQREIDRLKDGRDGRRSDRARKAASTFLEIAQLGSQEQRTASPHVTLNLDETSRPKQDLDNLLDYSQNDDRIIGHLAQFREDNPFADVRLLTRDSGLVLTARNLSLPCEVPPDDWLLRPEPDDRDRKIQELTRQLGELQAQEPAFQFSCDQQSDARPGHVEIAYEAFRPLDQTERVQVLQRLQNLYPPTVVKKDRLSAKAISYYEERGYLEWIAQCRELLDLVNFAVQFEHCPELTVRIQNNGSRPATSALVEIRVTGTFGLTAPMSELKEIGLAPVAARPIPPEQPQPQSWWTTMLHLDGSSLLARRELDFSPRFRDQEDFEYASEVRAEPEPSLRFTCDLWRHSLEPKEFTVRLVPATIDSPITGEIICAVHADNLTKPATFKLVVTLSPDYRPTLMPALQWFTTPHPDETQG